MLRYVTIVMWCLVLPSVGFANPFADSEKVAEPNPACKYSEIYSATQKTYLILNLVEKLYSKKEDLNYTSDLILEKAAEEVVKDCSSAQKIKISEISYHKDMLTFEYGAGKHSVEWLKKEGSEYLVYKKLYGTYKNEPIMVLKFATSQKKDFARITGRFGPESSHTRYTFFFQNEDSAFSSKIKLEGKNSKDIRSLDAIYGSDFEKVEPVIRIGVVGTGLDYNHPGVAKHLAYRSEMEKDLQRLEHLEHELRVNPFLSSSAYQPLMQKFNSLKPKVGFPLWMDQALGTKMPYDDVIINKKKSIDSKEHETRVTSRMLRAGGPVEVHFARRSMGSIDDLNVTEVIDQFAKKGVRLVNLSFGSSCGRLPKEEKMWGEAFEAYPEIVFVVSAGNSGRNTDTTPFCPAVFSKDFKNVISVTALDPNGQLAVYYGTAVNFGLNVDLAIKSDNLEVLIPFRKKLKWENNANGATSLAAAEVSRILTEAALEGLDWDAQTVKEALVESSDYNPVLEGVNKTASEVNESAFRERLKLTVAE